jgi:secondary thiamine-phosphate synthase enzyme
VGYLGANFESGAAQLDEHCRTEKARSSYDAGVSIARLQEDRMVTVRAQSQRHREMVDVTRLVREAVRTMGIQTGLCCVFVPHTTAGITINENADPDVPKDMLRWAEEALGDERRFAHWEGNAGGHILASVFGSSVTVPVENSDLALGRWQAIYLMEGDGPRERTLNVTIVAGGRE